MAGIFLKHLSRIKMNYSGALLNKKNLLNREHVCLFLNSKSSIYTSQIDLSDPENPFKRTFKILNNDFKEMKKLLVNPQNYKKPHHFPTHCDVLIIGGGVMGFSVAYWLKQRALDGLQIVVVEKDPSYLKSTSALSVGGIRQQFSLKENIELSLYSAEFLRNIKTHLGIEGEEPPEINFNPAGYLFLASEKSAELVKDNVQLQTSLGAKVELLNPEKLKENFPWMNTDGIALASHGLENEGWFDPWSLLLAFRKKAMHLGVHYVIGELTAFEFSEDTEGNYSSLKEAIIKLPDGKEKSVAFGIGVIAAGAMSAHVAKLAGIGVHPEERLAPLPVAPRKRYVHTVHCPDGPGFNLPFLIDYTGAYIRREGIGGNYLCGISPAEEDEPSVDNLEVDDKFFEEKVWPIIANRIPAFEKCKLKNAWAGFYDVNLFDENAFVGPHPGYHNLYLVTGFSGHGIQQAPGIGRAVMEMIIDGGFQTIDLSRLSFRRYLEEQPLWESNIV